MGLFSFLFGEKKPEVIEIPERPQLTSDTRTFRIAGAMHNCSYGDIGPVSGQTIDDPNNKYDRNAVMVVDANTTTLLGYIAREDKAEYRKFANGRERMPFVGFVERFTTSDGEELLFGIIRIISNDDEDVVMEDANKEWEYLTKAFRIKDYDKRMEVLDRFKYD